MLYASYREMLPILLHCSAALSIFVFATVELFVLSVFTDSDTINHHCQFLYQNTHAFMS